MFNTKEGFVEPEAVKFWGDLYTLYYGNVCRCYLPTVNIIDISTYKTSPFVTFKLMTGTCKNCGLNITTRKLNG